MRLTLGSEVSDIEQTKIFAQWTLDLGEGKVGCSNDGEATIDIPDDLLIADSPDPIPDLIDFVYPSIVDNSKQPNFFRERAILATKNDVVQEINDHLLSMFPGMKKNS
ncbi:putative DNA helicase Pif1 [Helianthus debilis subsp. tardiflorus]